MLKGELEKQEKETMKLITNHDPFREKQEPKTRRLEKAIEWLRKEKDALESAKVLFLAKCLAMEQQVCYVGAEQKLTGENNELVEEIKKRLREILEKSEADVKKLEWHIQRPGLAELRNRLSRDRVVENSSACRIE